jgi:hypothetical protein
MTQIARIWKKINRSRCKLTLLEKIGLDRNIEFVHFLTYSLQNSQAQPKRGHNKK